MTIAVTRNTPGRFDGYLCSCMQEIAPGVYVAPHMTAGVRERVWQTMMEWSELLDERDEEAGVVLFWDDPDAPSGMGKRLLGWPKKDLTEHEGLWLTMQDLTAEHDVDELQRLAARDVPTPAENEDAEVDDPTRETF
jgi:CRISPR-associated protein Cas2